MENYIIELKDISVSFDNEPVLENINLKIKDNQFVTILGPSGCGKTTTLRLIGGFLKPDSGRIFFDGLDITDMPPFKRKLNTVFQRYALFPHLNVFENVSFGLKIQKLPKKEIEDRVNKLLNIVNLADYGKRATDKLSGGQQQRVAIARALVNYPKLLLLDEPLGALDLKLRKEMQIELKNMQQQLKTTFVYVTHDQEEALTMSDMIVVMNEGQIQQIGSPQDIYNEPQNAFVADFIGQSNIINGVMRHDFLVSFAGCNFDCVDKGFAPMQRVDVVIRPEDIKISTTETENSLAGIVDSVIFKGVHYEIEVKAKGMYWLVQTTEFFEQGTKVYISVGPDDIHIMKKLFDKTTNTLNASVVYKNTISFLGIEFTKDNLPFDEGTELKLTIPPGSIEIVSSDHSDVTLYLETLIYKGAYNEMLFYMEDDKQDENYLLVWSQSEEEAGTELGLKFNFDKIGIKEANRI